MDIRIYAVALACASVFGCSSSSTANKAPVIDAVDMPGTAPMPASGAYVIQGSITFHDDDDTVKELHVALEGAPSVTTIQFPQQVMSGKAPLILSFSGSAATAGAVLNYSLSLVDARGLESAKTMKSVTLQ